MDANRFAKVNSVLGDALGLRRMRGRETLGQPFFYELELVSTNPAIDFSKILGTTMSVSLELPNDATRYFHGYVSQLSLLGGMGRYARYRAVLRPWFWLLSRTTNCRVINEKLTVPDLVMQIFRDRGFSDFEDRLTARPYRQWEYRVQYRESDFNFVSRMLEQEGIYYYFKHFADRHVLVLADDHGSHDPLENFASLPYYPPTAEDVRDLDHFDSWSMIHQIEPGGYIADDFNFEMPKQGNLRVPVSAPDEYAFGDYAHYDYPGEYDAHADGERYAKIRLEGLKADHEVFEGSGNARAVSPGGLFTLKGFPREDQNRQYLIVSASYEITSDAYETSSAPQAHIGYRCTLGAIDATRPYRAPETTPKPKVDGPQTAVVVGESDAEITTDKYGRVKVQFPWDRVGEFNEKSSCWVRVSQVWAGSGFGAMHIPRIGQEVVVDFLEGDPDRPIIIGRVYNADNMPPYTLPANRTQSGIKSRSSKGGEPNNFNEIRMEDLKGQEELFIQAEKNQTVNVKHNQSISVGADRSVSVGGNESYTVQGTRSSTITKKETQTFKDAREMTVAQTDDVTITKLHSGTYHGGRTEKVDGANDELEVTGVDKKATVHGKYNVIADTLFEVKQGGNTFHIEEKIDGITGGGPIKFTNGSAEVKLEGAKLMITANSEISLVSGGASITLKSDGTVEIKGAQKVNIGSGPTAVALDPTGVNVSGTKIASSAIGMHEITGAMVKIN